MKKLKLNVEDLAVDSLEMAAAEGPRGTVQGAAEATEGCTQACSPNLWEYLWNQTWKVD